MVDNHSSISVTVGTVLIMRYDYIRCMVMIQGSLTGAHDGAKPRNYEPPCDLPIEMGH